MTAEKRRLAGLALLLPVLLFGLFASALMTWHHDTQLYGSEEHQAELIGCKESATVNCDIVNTSAWSELGTVPIATLSFGCYLTLLAMAVDALRGRDTSRAFLMVAGAVAVAMSAFLFYQSKVELGYVCAWCLRLYGVNAAVLVLSSLGGRPDLPDRGQTLLWGVGFVGVLLVVSGGERVYRASLADEPAPEVAAAPDEREQDPEGPAPTLSFTVKTEDGRDATLTLDADDAWTGNRDATVAVVMFGDLQCGYCKRSSAEIARLEATYGDRVLFAFKHFAMDPACNPGVNNPKHKYACLAAKASVCAQRQRGFWAFHDLAYKNQHQLGADALRHYVEAAGLDAKEYDRCMASDEPDAVVRHDGEVGKSLDIHGTPRIFINGALYRSGTSAEAMARAIEVALGASAADATRSAAALRGAAANSMAPIPEDVPSVRTVVAGDMSFAIDTFEAAIRDGVAVSGKHEIPALRTTWFEAKAACEKAGKRLCTEREWVTACQGAAAGDDDGDGAFADDMIEGTSYPYGDYHERGRCWDDRTGDTFRPVYTGEMPGCVTPAGVYDLTGNVEEWVGATPEEAVLLGGAWDTSEDHARCYRRSDSFGAGYASARTGFRCCSR